MANPKVGVFRRQVRELVEALLNQIQTSNDFNTDVGNDVHYRDRVLNDEEKQARDSYPYLVFRIDGTAGTRTDEENDQLVDYSVRFTVYAFIWPEDYGDPESEFTEDILTALNPNTSQGMIEFDSVVELPPEPGLDVLTLAVDFTASVTAQCLPDEAQFTWLENL